jgi:hypothetical protein
LKRPVMKFELGSAMVKTEKGCTEEGGSVWVLVGLLL